MEKVPEVFDFLDPDHTIFVQELPKEPVDLFLVLDSSSKDRLGEAQAVFDTAKQTACVDHHVSNLGYAKDNFVKPGCSSACEVLYGLMEEELIDEKIAEALYIGIIMDTGVFRYSCTHPSTMRTASWKNTSYKHAFDGWKGDRCHSYPEDAGILRRTDRGHRRNY